MENKLVNTDEYISELIEKYSDLVLRLALTYLKNMPDAEDISQDVFIKILRQRKLFNDSEHEKAWFIRVTINACKDFLRNPWRKFKFTTVDSSLPIKDKENEEVVSMVLELPIKYRSVIYLYYFENYHTSEIAALLDRKESTVRTQLKRAREILKAKMLGGFDNE